MRFLKFRRVVFSMVILFWLLFTVEVVNVTQSASLFIYSVAVANDLEGKRIIEKALSEQGFYRNGGHEIEEVVGEILLVCKEEYKGFGKFERWYIVDGKFMREGWIRWCGVVTALITFWGLSLVYVYDSSVKSKDDAGEKDLDGNFPTITGKV